jgi:hypothetical protein
VRDNADLFVARERGFGTAFVFDPFSANDYDVSTSLLAWMAGLAIWLLAT